METEWDWLDTNNSSQYKWVPYEKPFQTVFNNALKNGRPKIGFDVSGVKYELDFQKMCQKNLKTKYERAIRMRIRVNDDDDEDEDKNDDNYWYYWEWKNDSNRWIMYPPEINLELETHYRNYLDDRTKDSFKIEIGETRVAYLVDFVKMAQINSKSSFTRNVRRSVANGKFKRIFKQTKILYLIFFYYYY